MSRGYVTTNQAANAADAAMETPHGTQRPESRTTIEAVAKADEALDSVVESIEVTKKDAAKRTIDLTVHGHDYRDGDRVRFRVTPSYGHPAKGEYDADSTTFVSATELHATLTLPDDINLKQPGGPRATATATGRTQSRSSRSAASVYCRAGRH